MSSNLTKSCLLALIALALFASAPAEAAPLCWDTADTTTYYSDASYTTVVGSCTYNNCWFTMSCTGTTSPYSVETWRTIPCNNCVACGTCWPISSHDAAPSTEAEGEEPLLREAPAMTPAFSSPGCVAAA